MFIFVNEHKVLTLGNLAASAVNYLKLLIL